MRRFVVEAVIVATYGHLMVPTRPVDFVIPYSSIAELYELRESSEPLMSDAYENEQVKARIEELIQFFEKDLNRKKLDKTLQMPWRESAPLLVNDRIQLTVVYAMDNAHYGEIFDPIETEMILTSIKLQVPILTDQIEFQEKLIDTEVPVQIYDIEDFEFAVEEGIDLGRFQED